MQKKSVIIQGSSRSQGDTFAFLKELNPSNTTTHIDLKNYSIAHFDYEAAYKQDDYLALTEKLITSYDVFILATPVYWYSMSGIMKVFLDRFTDLLTINKPLGHQLRGKYLSVISISNSDDVDDSFYRPFELTAAYLGMTYLGHMHAYGDSSNINIDTQQRLYKFRKQNFIST